MKERCRPHSEYRSVGNAERSDPRGEGRRWEGVSQPEESVHGGGVGRLGRPLADSAVFRRRTSSTHPTAGRRGPLSRSLRFVTRVTPGPRKTRYRPPDLALQDWTFTRWVSERVSRGNCSPQFPRTWLSLAHPVSVSPKEESRNKRNGYGIPKISVAQRLREQVSADLE